MSRRRKAKPNRNKRSDRKKRRCSSGKVAFRFEGEAERALRDRPNESLTSYRCTECNQWHLGNKVPRSVRRREAETGKSVPPP